MTAPRPVVLLNPHGGSAGDEAEAKVAAALAGSGVDGDIVVTAGGKIADRAAQAVRDGAPMVIAAGGDGTVSAVAGAVAESATVMGILPLGTLNHFARDLGIRPDLDDAARTIARGNVQSIDAATMNGRLFVNNSAIGLYPLMVADREAQQHRLGRSKRAAMIVAGLRTLAQFRHHRLTLTVNDTAQATIDTPLLFVGNNDYRIALPRAGARDALDDARLSVVLLRRHSRLAFVGALLRGLVGRSRADDLIHLDDVTSLRVISRRSRLTVAIDGETSEQPPTIDYRIRPAALKVIVP